jgi:5'-3' exonuclease
VEVHLVDGTYELFRHHYGRLAAMRKGSSDARDQPGAPGETAAAARGVVATVIGMLAGGVTHLAVASDHVIESFRNELWEGYKTSAGMPPELLAQIPMLEEALVDLGVTTWAMVEYEADDALGAAAAVAAADERVERVVIWTPDKDLGQCVRGTRVVQCERRTGNIIDEDGVRARFGVGPESIADYLALVGDSADGYPGLEGWGAKSAAAVLARYGHLDDVPASAGQWDVPGLRNAARLAKTLAEQLPLALLFRRIATVEVDVPVGAVDQWRWRGPTPAFESTAERLGEPNLARRARELAKLPRFSS